MDLSAREKQRIRSRRHYEKNKSLYVVRAKEWARKHPEKIKEWRRLYAQRNRAKLNELAYKTYHKNPERFRQRSREWRRRYPEHYAKNREKNIARATKWNHENRERRQGILRKYRERNRGKIQLSQKKHYYKDLKRSRQKSRERQIPYSAKHAERLREKRTRVYYSNLEESRRRGRINAKNYRIKNPEGYHASRRRTYEKNREKILKRVRVWQKANPERTRANKRMGALRRIERKMHLKHAFTIKEWQEKVKGSHGFCAICKKNVGIEKLTMDHIVPISKAPVGFVCSIDKVQPVCGSCNSRKHNRI